MRIIIAGSRTLDDYKFLCTNVIKVLKEIEQERNQIKHDEIEIITGLAKGADKLGEKFALDNKINHKGFPAQWNILGSAAGMVRNEQMAKYASAEKDNEGILIAFWDGESSGTKNMIDLGYKYNLKVFVIKFSPN